MARRENMQRSYEAIYESGGLRWVSEHPTIPDGERVLVVVEGRSRPERAGGEETRKLLDAAWGCVEPPRTADDIDRDIARMRAEWDRDWDR